MQNWSKQAKQLMFNLMRGQVFLQFKDETKRATLPDDLRYLDDIRELFLHTFSDSISRDYVTSSFVKIYIQNPGKEGLFYELDDLSSWFWRIKIFYSASFYAAVDASIIEKNRLE
ncbi:hypothetical protein D917_00092, partial [Trichinella nativa]